MTTYICWVIVLSIIANALRGVHQSQVMCKPTDPQHRQIVWDRHDEIDSYNYVMSWVDFIRQFDLGPRGHVWYRWYHAIDAGSFVAFAGLVCLLIGGFAYECIVEVLAYKVVPTWFIFQAVAEELILHYVWLSGLSLAFMWLAYEPTYQYGRYKTVFDTAYKEHVNFFDVISFRASKWTMTAIRLTLVAAMIGGMIWMNFGLAGSPEL